MLTVYVTIVEGPYMPPESALEELNISLSSISSGIPLVLCGDFNVPAIDWSMASPSVLSPIASQLCSITHNNCLSQLIVHPTRGINILDLVFANNPDSIFSVRVV